MAWVIIISTTINNGKGDIIKQRVKDRERNRSQAAFFMWNQNGQFDLIMVPMLYEIEPCCPLSVKNPNK